ncbi:Os08g0183700 [Oryza sativa Japonica Group]|uniref:Os08g0183700 protein n=1 Tax=Oryza sativa subsp. japonica TaxID=39947 RepID=A0A0P0XCK6_ORYSJ|nr:Os08g0183700 [Oryza sativa Japonica Group]
MVRPASSSTKSAKLAAGEAVAAMGAASEPAARDAVANPTPRRQLRRTCSPALAAAGGGSTPAPLAALLSTRTPTASWSSYDGVVPHADRVG